MENNLFTKFKKESEIERCPICNRPYDSDLVNNKICEYCLQGYSSVYIKEEQK